MMCEYDVYGQPKLGLVERALKAEYIQPVATDQPYDLNDMTLYLNRELSWLEFNERVLFQASDRRKPILERVRFMAIAGSNMDEFFMKRIGGFKQLVAANVQEQTVDGRTPQQQIDECCAAVRNYLGRKEEVFEQLLSELHKSEIEILHYVELSPAEQALLREDFYDNIFPLVTPQSVDPAHPFPFISNLSLNLLVTLRYPGEKRSVTGTGQSSGRCWSQPFSAGRGGISICVVGRGDGAQPRPVVPWHGDSFLRAVPGDP